MWSTMHGPLTHAEPGRLVFKDNFLPKVGRRWAHHSVPVTGFKNKRVLTLRHPQESGAHRSEAPCTMEGHCRWRSGGSGAGLGIGAAQGRPRGPRGGITFRASSRFPVACWRACLAA